MTITRQQAIDHIRNAAAWLEANPDKHITISMAADKRGPGGEDVPPTHPSAECFCALGRIAKEANLFDMEDDPRVGRPHLSHYPIEAVNRFFEEHFPDTTGMFGSRLSTLIYEINDGIHKQRGYDGRPDAIAFLRRLADGEISL